MMKLKTIVPIFFLLAVLTGCSSDDDANGLSCPQPTDLTATNISATTADLGWTETGAATSYDVELGTTGFESTGTPTSEGVSNPYTATGLTAETSYEFYVRANCENGTTSGWAGPFEFTTPVSRNYFPLTTGNSWSYNNEQQINQQSPTQSQETMTVENSSEEGGITYFNLDTDNALTGGLVTRVLSNGELSKVGGELLYDGSITFDLSQLGLTPIQIPLENAVIFSVNADSGTELFSFSDTVEQDIVLGGQSVHLTIDYTVSTINMATLPTFSAGGQEFQDVLQANLLVTASVTGTVGPISVEILANPEVVVAANYYADGVGLIFSEVENNFDFADNLPFPTVADIQISSTQEIDTYTVAP